MGRPSDLGGFYDESLTHDGCHTGRPRVLHRALVDDFLDGHTNSWEGIVNGMDRDHPSRTGTPRNLARHSPREPRGMITTGLFAYIMRLMVYGLIGFGVIAAGLGIWHYWHK